MTVTMTVKVKVTDGDGHGEGDSDGHSLGTLTFAHLDITTGIRGASRAANRGDTDQQLRFVPRHREVFTMVEKSLRWLRSLNDG